MRKKYVLFDLDGTLTDSQDGIMNSIEYTLNHYGIRVEDRAALRPWLGPPLADSLMKYHGFDRERALEGVKKYREYFDVKGIFENRVYDGMEELLGKLQSEGYILMTATSKPEVAARRITDHFNLTRFFTFVGGATLDDSRVHKGDVIRYVLEANQIKDLSSVMMVGDRENDILGAKQNGLEAIGVLYGYGDREELEAAGADHIAETVGDIAKYL